MSFQIPKEQYTGMINTVSLGEDFKVGGEKVLPFHNFEGEIPHNPIVAMEVFDKKPEDWPEGVFKYYEDVADSPIDWAKKCVDEFGADSICLQLTRSNPDGGDMSAEDAANLVKEVREAVSVPIVAYGSGSLEAVSDVMKKVSEVNADTDILLGWAEEDSYKTIAAAAMGYNNNLISLNPLDVNIAKQLNILLTQLGLSPHRIVMDPSSSGLGYGIEYCLSAMERLKIAALLQDDKMTQMPLINNVAMEIWKVKEVKGSEEEYPEWGELETRGINWETISAMCFFLSGSNIVTMRHPKAVKLVKEAISELMAT